jgi:hypothetical protein
MEFHEHFKEAVTEINNRRLSDPRVQEAVNHYHGRSLVFKVRDDATYVFHISNDGIEYETNPDTTTDDMYLEMDLARAKRLVYHQSLGIFDIPFIVHRNITLADIDFARSIFGKKHQVGA